MTLWFIPESFLFIGIWKVEIRKGKLESREDVNGIISQTL